MERHEIGRDFRNDIPIWEAKRYFERPLLSKADGPLIDVRRWCRQFYAAQGLSGIRSPGLALAPHAAQGA